MGSSGALPERSGRKTGHVHIKPHMDFIILFIICGDSCQREPLPFET